MSRRSYVLQARDHCLSLGHDTRLMGIINVTPDSFSRDGILSSKKSVDLQVSLRRALRMEREGADIIDIGGESTRPGAARVPVAEELRRVIPVIKAVVRQVKVPVSVDTCKFQVAKEALAAGASIVNNVKGTAVDSKFLKLVRDYNAAIVLMHMRGTPRTMHLKSHYKDLVNDIIGDLAVSIEKCLEIGIKKDRIIIDPGIGFAKTLEGNLTLINQLACFDVLRCPVLLGTSRKSFIGQLLKNKVDERLIGTVASVAAGIFGGAHIVRVHDIKPIKETTVIIDAIINTHP